MSVIPSVTDGLVRRSQRPLPFASRRYSRAAYARVPRREADQKLGEARLAGNVSRIEVNRGIGTREQQ